MMASNLVAFTINSKGFEEGDIFFTLVCCKPAPGMECATRGWRYWAGNVSSQGLNLSLTLPGMGHWNGSDKSLRIRVDGGVIELRAFPHFNDATKVARWNEVFPNGLMLKIFTGLIDIFLPRDLR